MTASLVLDNTYVAYYNTNYAFLQVVFVLSCIYYAFFALFATTELNFAVSLVAIMHLHFTVGNSFFGGELYKSSILVYNIHNDISHLRERQKKLMSIQFTVPLQKIIDTLNLGVCYQPDNLEDILISSTDINRPGLQFAGFFDYFDNKRIQLIGKNEMAYLAQRDESKQLASLESFFAAKPSAVILSRGFEPTATMLSLAKEHNVPILATPEPTSNFSAALNSLLNAELAPRVTRHGVLVEVYGEGVLLLGDSGVGKSETAIELVKRGHRLIADDAVEIRRIDNKTLIGSSPENIRHFLELRGIGIINVRKIFGIGSVKVTEEINMLINMELWNQNKTYDRMGVENEFTDILGLPVNSLTIPVKPGRNLAIIIEVAAMNNRQKRMGYNAAHELLERLGMSEDIPKDSKHRQFDF